ncbi:hypothetical protein K3M35_05125 [Rhodococcus sp. DMU2021]|uniref:hypothetical protein n=1 Tax=Rhodococcus sp. DMU2021 TaxID=2866997 RepID=UPI001C7DFED0|nr:hypothetical protein [Rhodococcus sp. DMU2021]MBX4168048.1 hypothetical protein [Rhodococcus sp. DMU2021]
MTAPLPILVEASDVETRLGETLAESELGQVESIIELVSEKLRSPSMRRAVGDIDQRLADGDLRPGLVRGILVTVVCRAFDAHRVGLRVRSEQFPEVQTTYADPNSELVYFTDSELADLAPAADVDQGGSFSIRIA